MPEPINLHGKVDCYAMREVNQSIVLDLIRSGGKISRAELVRATALTKPTVNSIVDDLIAQDVVRDVGLGETAGVPGRRPRLIELNRSSAGYLGICFEVDATKVALADAVGEIRATRLIETPAGDPPGAVASVLAVLEGLLEETGLEGRNLAAVGVAVAGVVDVQRGNVVRAASLDWTNVSLRASIERRMKVPVVVNNVARAGAIAEGTVGAARGAGSYVWVALGAELGAGIVLDGRVLLGARGFGGGQGKCLVVDERCACPCGLASDHSVVTLSQLIGVVDPELVVFGGRDDADSDSLIERVRASHAQVAANLPLIRSALGRDAILVGAVLSALHQSVPSHRVVTTRDGFVSNAFVQPGA